MLAPVAAAALALLSGAAEPFDLPPLPRPDEGYAALWQWLSVVNAQLTIPDTEFRWMFGGISIPILGLFELVGIRRDWKLYPFLLPFWLIFGGVALGVVGGLAAGAAHVVLFPIGRTWFSIRDRRRTREATGREAAGRAASALSGTSSPPRRPPPLPPRTAQDTIRAAVEALRTAARARPGQPTESPRAAFLRALGEVLSVAAGAARPPPGAERPPPGPARPPAHPAEPSSEATGAAPAKPDLGAFKPDLSRFRRRPPGH